EVADRFVEGDGDREVARLGKPPQAGDFQVAVALDQVLDPPLADRDRHDLERRDDFPSVCQSFLRSRAAPTRPKSEKPRKSRKGNGVNVSSGSSKSARKNTASVSAEPTTNSTINSLS